MLLPYRFAEGSTPVRSSCLSPEDCAGIVRAAIGDAIDEQEHLYVVCLNVRNEVLDLVLVSKGSVSSVEAHPRDVFRVALKANASGIVLAHNHPSGNPTPSHEDVVLTDRFEQAGKLLGIPLIDHVVVTAHGHTSIVEYREIGSRFSSTLIELF